MEELQTKTYTIKNEDKAAFLNRVEKLGIDTNSHDITDDPFEDNFTIVIRGTENINMVNRILKTNTAIDPLKASKSSKLEERLRSIIKEQVKKQFTKS